MPEIVIKPDQTYGLELIRERFEVPADSVPNDSDTPAKRAMKLLFIEACAKKAGQAAIERYERLRHWKFRDDLPVELDESVLQLDLDSWEFSSPNSKDPIAKDRGLDSFKTNRYAYVLKMWFVTPEIRTVVWKSDPSLEHEDEYGRAEGFVAPEEIDAPYKTEEEKEIQNGNA